MVNNNPLHRYRVFIPTAFAGLLLLFVHIANACEPPPDLIVNCSETTTEYGYFLFDNEGSLSDNLHTTLSACPSDGLPIHELQSLIEPLARRSDIYLIMVTPSDPNDLASDKNRPTAQDCTTRQFVETKHFTIAYVIRQPYCVPVPVRCGTVNVLSPRQKILFDFQTGNYIGMVSLLLMVVVGSTSGIKVSQQAYANGERSILIVGPLRKLVPRIFISITGLLLIRFGFFISFSYTLDFSKWLLYPSIPEYILRTFLMFVVGSFIIHQIRYRRSNEPPR